MLRQSKYREVRSKPTCQLKAPRVEVRLCNSSNVVMHPNSEVKKERTIWRPSYVTVDWEASEASLIMNSCMSKTTLLSIRYTRRNPALRVQTFGVTPSKGSRREVYLSDFWR